MEKTRSPSFAAARDMLPPSMHSQLDQMVQEYQFAALKVHGAKMVSPKVIAELILLGWVSPAIQSQNQKAEK